MLTIAMLLFPRANKSERETREGKRRELPVEAYVGTLYKSIFPIKNLSMFLLRHAITTATTSIDTKLLQLDDNP